MAESRSREQKEPETDKEQGADMTPESCIDLSAERTTKTLDHIVDDGRAWLGADIDPQDCVLPLETDVLHEIRNVIEKMQLNPLPTLLRLPEQFELSLLPDLMARVKAMLDSAFGVVVIDALRLDEMDEQDAIALYWILGQLIARPVAQKWDGTMFYDVRDTGQPYSYGVRGSYTNVELLFHTDNAFAVAPPHYVGLLCLRPAVEGGISRFCSLYAIHNRMLADYPRELRRLYEPVMWDRQAEHAPGQPKVALAPMFRYESGQLSARINVSLVRKGYEVADRKIDAQTADALAALQTVADDRTLWFELPIERGHLQYLNNRHIVHYRSEFQDHADPTLKRHLVRTWHRDTGLPTYDG
ncbi:MAG: TauD/TfdA family dioxygenase [Gammaproteobacteria bacterium]